MKSITTLYKIGFGPSSSHTMGPEQACLLARKQYSNIKYIDVTLYASLALTGKGHLTDKIITKTLAPIPCDITFDYKTPVNHANTFVFKIFLEDGQKILWHIKSIGGGDIVIDELEQATSNENQIPFNSWQEFKDNFNTSDEIIDFLLTNDQSLKSHINHVFDTMINCIDLGKDKTEILPGKLQLPRFGHQLLANANNIETYLAAYAQIVGEENASGNKIVTAPTCGACGIIPAIIYYYYKHEQVSRDKLERGLIIAGLIGNLIRHNASISGAEAGCQAEIGSATSMGAVLISYLHNLDLQQIEIAAIIGLEHQLGLTCDPILGYVQYPCINRNAMGVVKAYHAYQFAKNNIKQLLDLDKMIDVMYQTGTDLKNEYRETSLGGIAKAYEQEK